MESPESTLDYIKRKNYIKRKRREAFHEVTDIFTEGWTEQDWIAKAYHWHHGTKVYHSYSDYCDD